MYCSTLLDLEEFYMETTNRLSEKRKNAPIPDTDALPIAKRPKMAEPALAVNEP